LAVQSRYQLVSAENHARISLHFAMIATGVSANPELSCKKVLTNASNVELGENELTKQQNSWKPRTIDSLEFQLASSQVTKIAHGLGFFVNCLTS
jgi:hypothetical protein